MKENTQDLDKMPQKSKIQYISVIIAFMFFQFCTSKDNSNRKEVNHKYEVVINKKKISEITDSISEVKLMVYGIDYYNILSNLSIDEAELLIKDNQPIAKILGVSYLLSSQNQISDSLRIKFLSDTTELWVLRNNKIIPTTVALEFIFIETGEWKGYETESVFKILENVGGGWWPQLGAE